MHDDTPLLFHQGQVTASRRQAETEPERIREGAFGIPSCTGSSGRERVPSAGERSKHGGQERKDQPDQQQSKPVGDEKQQAKTKISGG